MGSGCSSLKTVHSAEATPVSSLATFKIVLVGESLSGRTSILNRYVNNSFSGNYKPTKTVDIVSIVKKVNFPDERIVAIEFWDTPSQIDTQVLNEYLKNADAAIVTVDICEAEALSYASKWKNNFNEIEKVAVKRKNSTVKKKQDFPVLLIGTKLDLLKKRNELDGKKLTSLDKTLDIIDSDVTMIDNEAVMNAKEDYSSCQSQEIMHKNKVLEIETKIIDADSNHNGKLTNLNGNVLESHGDLLNSDAEILKGNDESRKHDGELLQQNDNLTDHEQESLDKNNKSTKESLKQNEEMMDPDIKSIEQNSESTNHDNESTKQNNKLKRPDEENSECNDEAKNHETEATDSNDKLNNNNAETLELNVDLKNGDEEVSKKVAESEKHDKEASNINDPKNDDITATNHNNDLKNIDQPTTKLKDDLKSHDSEPFEHNDKLHSYDEQSESLSKLNLNKGEIDLAQENQTKLLESRMAPWNGKVDSIPIYHITKLKNFASEKQFFAGICVSSRDSDGGVHEAIQSLIRHLIGKNYLGSEMKRKIGNSSLSVASSSKKPKQNHNIEENFEPLQEIGIVEVDEVIQLSNRSLKEVEVVFNKFYDALLYFKRVCYDEGLVSKSNFEGCIAALKQAVESTPKKNSDVNDIRVALLSRDNHGFSLVATDEGKQLFIEVVDEDHNRIEIRKKCPLSKNLVTLLDFLNDNVLKSCAEVLSKFDGMQQQLANHHSALTDKEEKAWDVAVAAGRSQSDVRRILTGIAQSKARVKGSLDQLQDVRGSADELITKTKATLLF